MNHLTNLAVFRKCNSKHKNHKYLYMHVLTNEQNTEQIKFDKSKQTPEAPQQSW